jgi:feruloyl-CoA synthase
LPQHVWDALQDLAVETCGEEILMVTGLGATETAPAAICTGREGAASGWIGVPLPGLELKLSPVGDKIEARLRGPNVTPGYWRDPRLNLDAFDEEGFYKLGDAVRWVDSANPEFGLMFDGRLNEDFKLSSGTWVSVGPLRARLVRHFGSLLHDIVITAPDRDVVGALVFPNEAACRGICPGAGPDVQKRDVLDHPDVRARFGDLLTSFAAANPGSSAHVARALLLVDPPSFERCELTDKGSINQKAVMLVRAAEVEELYRQPSSPRVITTDGLT